MQRKNHFVAAAAAILQAANMASLLARVFGSGLPRVGNPVAARAAVAGRCSTELSMSSRRTILSSAPTTTRAITADLCPLLSSIRQLSISATNSHYAKMGIYRAQALAQKRGRPDPFEGQPKIVYGCQRNCRTSPWKLNLVAKLIRGMKIDEAIRQMEFSQKKASKNVLRVLKITKQNAKVHHQVEDNSDMFVREAYVGKGQNLRGIRYHAQGRSGRVTKPRTHFFIKLQEGENPYPELKALKKAKKAAHIPPPKRVRYSLECN